MAGTEDPAFSCEGGFWGARQAGAISLESGWPVLRRVLLSVLHALDSPCPDSTPVNGQLSVRQYFAFPLTVRSPLGSLLGPEQQGHIYMCLDLRVPGQKLVIVTQCPKWLVMPFGLYVSHVLERLEMVWSGKNFWLLAEQEAVWARSKESKKVADP